jgi:hypothetical protein
MRSVGDVAGLSDAVAARVRREWLAMIASLRLANPAADLAPRIHHPLPLAGVDAAIASLAAAEAKQYVATGIAVAADATRQLAAPARVRKDQAEAAAVEFDASAPSVLTWAERSRLDLIRDITTEQRILIRAALIGAEESGESPLVTARQIRESIGLSEAQLEWVANFRRSLEAGDLSAAAGRALVDGRTERMLSSAAARGAKLTPAQIDAAVERYRNAMVNYRAETIARTEAARIVGQGTTEAYNQAIASGQIAAEQIECTWLHSPRARDKSHEREFHAVMHGQTRAWGEPFESGLGNLLLFPCDPAAPVKETANCRCARTVRIRPASVRMAA